MGGILEDGIAVNFDAAASTCLLLFRQGVESQRLKALATILLGGVAKALTGGGKAGPENLSDPARSSPVYHAGDPALNEPITDATPRHRTVIWGAKT